jgi:hypothetical protein
MQEVLRFSLKIGENFRHFLQRWRKAAVKVSKAGGVPARAIPEYHRVKNVYIKKDERLAQKSNDRNSPFVSILWKNAAVLKYNLIY